MPFLTITLVFYILKKILLDALAFKLSVLSALLYFVPQESHWAVLDSKYSTKVKIKYTCTKYQQIHQIHLYQIHLDKVPNTPNTPGKSTKYTWTFRSVSKSDKGAVNTQYHLVAKAPISHAESESSCDKGPVNTWSGSPTWCEVSWGI